MLSFYFKPDLSAGSFRATAFVDAIKEKMPNGGQIDVLTTLPNRYSSFVVESPAEEQMPGLSIFRIGVLPCQNGRLGQAIAFIKFAREVLQHTHGQHYDLVFATSSRLMTAVLGAWVARKNRAPLYLDIRDILVDTIKDVLPWYLAIVTKTIFIPLESWVINSASKVNLVSRGFSEYFLTRYPKQRFSYFTNGIDDEFLTAPEPLLERKPNDFVEILYAGNLGEGQGLHLIIPSLARRLNGKIRFKIIGDGGRKEALRLALINAGADNVEILPPMHRAQLLVAYQTADVLFLHLNDYDAFKKVLPAKLFEYGAMGKPSWAGVSGYAEKFIIENISNAAVFSPCDSEDAASSFATLDMVTQPRDIFVAKFSRNRIMKSMAIDVINIMQKKL